MNTETRSPSTLEAALIQAGAFHPDDLPYNQAGELSPAQKRWLVLEVTAWLALATPELGLAVVMWVFYFQHLILTVLLLALTWGSYLVFLAAMCGRDAWQIVEEIRQDRVDIIEGVISKHCTRVSINRGYGYVYSLEIRGHSFEVHQALYNAIAKDTSYRLYYIPGHCTLINVEPRSHLDERRQTALAALQQRHAGWE